MIPACPLLFLRMHMHGFWTGRNLNSREGHSTSHPRPSPSQSSPFTVAGGVSGLAYRLHEKCLTACLFIHPYDACALQAERKGMGMPPSFPGTISTGGGMRSGLTTADNDLTPTFTRPEPSTFGRSARDLVRPCNMSSGSTVGVLTTNMAKRCKI